MPEPLGSKDEVRAITPGRKGLSPLETGVLCLVVLLTTALAASGLFSLLPFQPFGSPLPPSRVCFGRMKQLGIALQMYVQDYNDQLPSAGAWSQQLMPYIQREDVDACPSRPEQNAGYAFNSRVSGLRIRQLANPAVTPALFESNLGTPNAWDQLQSFTTPHDGQGHVVFADGHVQALPTAPTALAGLPVPSNED